MSFTSINGASAPGIDISSSMAQANAAIFQNFTEASRQNLHIAAAVAAAAQPKKNYRDESRGGSGDPTTSADDERKGVRQGSYKLNYNISSSSKWRNSRCSSNIHLAAAVARSKAPPTSNGIVYSEHSNPPNLVERIWKKRRLPPKWHQPHRRLSKASPTPAPATADEMRIQPNHTQISFCGGESEIIDDDNFTRTTPLKQ
nr:protein TIME FOR COFFEE isoform X5 [Ipomoea batatas]